MSEEMLKRDIVQDLDRLSPENLKEVREFIESLRRSQSASYSVKSDYAGRVRDLKIPGMSF